MGKFPLTIFIPAFLGIGSLVLSGFWPKSAKWRGPKCYGARFSKKEFWANLGQKLPKIRVFWTQFFLIFGRKMEGDVLKNGFVKYGIYALGKFPFTIFLLPAFLSLGLSCVFKRLTSFSYSLAIFLFLSDLIKIFIKIGLTV